MNIAKALGIIAMVLGHSGNGPIEHFVNLYHMSLFIFISGYFYNDKYTHNPKSLIKKRFISLYKPYLIYELIYLSLHNFFFKINFYSTSYGVPIRMIAPYDKMGFLKAFLAILVFAGREPMAGVFWFFAVLFFVNVMFCMISFFIEKIFNKDREYIRAIIIVIIFVVSSLLTKYVVTIPRFNNSLSMVLIYYMGYMFKRYEKHINTENIYLFLISIILLLTSSLYGAIGVGANNFLSPDFLIFCAILGVYINIYLSKLILRRNIFNKILFYIGDNTVSIMALHYLSFKVISFIIIKIYNYPISALAQYPVITGIKGWFILYTLAGIFIPISLTYIYRKLKLRLKA